MIFVGTSKLFRYPLNNFELGVTIISQYARQLHTFTVLRQEV